MKITSLTAVFACLTIHVTTHASPALTGAGILSPNKVFRADINLGIANSNRASIEGSNYITVQTGATSFISIPTNIQSKQFNSDSFIATLGLRYGLTNDIEIYGRTSGVHSKQRVHFNSQSESKSDSRYIDTWLGFNYRFKNEDAKPAIIGFSEVAIHEKEGQENIHLKAFLLGATLYRSFDPVVLSFSGAFRRTGSRFDGNNRVNPSDMMLLQPSMSFARNTSTIILQS